MIKETKTYQVKWAETKESKPDYPIEVAPPACINCIKCTEDNCPITKKSKVSKRRD